MLFLSTLLVLFLQESIPGIKVVEKGIETAASSVHQEINTILSAIILAIIIAFICVVKYLIKDKKLAVIAARTDLAKEMAINEGAHQRLVEAKDKQINQLVLDNNHFKSKLEELADDNTEIYKQLVNKVGSFVEGQAVLSGQLERMKAELLLEIMRIFNKA